MEVFKRQTLPEKLYLFYEVYNLTVNYLQKWYTLHFNYYFTVTFLLYFPVSLSTYNSILQIMNCRSK